MLEELVSQIAAAVGMACPSCRSAIRWDRVKVIRQVNEKTFQLDLLCDRCQGGYNVHFIPSDPSYASARQKILGDRSLEEEARLLESGPVPEGYERYLPEVIDAIDPLIRWEDPYPPKATA
jgi:hypothetical protein